MWCATLLAGQHTKEKQNFGPQDRWSLCYLSVPLTVRNQQHSSMLSTYIQQIPRPLDLKPWLLDMAQKHSTHRSQASILQINGNLTSLIVKGSTTTFPMWVALLHLLLPCTSPANNISGQWLKRGTQDLLQAGNHCPAYDMWDFDILLPSNLETRMRDREQQRLAMPAAKLYLRIASQDSTELSLRSRPHTTTRSPWIRWESPCGMLLHSHHSALSPLGRRMISPQIPAAQLTMKTSFGRSCICSRGVCDLLEAPTLLLATSLQGSPSGSPETYQPLAFTVLHYTPVLVPLETN